MMVILTFTYFSSTLIPLDELYTVDPLKLFRLDPAKVPYVRGWAVHWVWLRAELCPMIFKEVRIWDREGDED